MISNQKYDRQIRLWKDHGQKLLENSDVLLINASATGTEALKNLVLPGIKSFTILDTRVVQDEDHDLFNNFFVPLEQSIGEYRAIIATKLLCELNPDVSGFALTAESIDQILGKKEEFLEKFDIVIYSQLGFYENVFMKLSRECHELGIPLVYVRSFGFVGHLRVQSPQHEVIESHAESLSDLRLDCAWPELVDYADQIPLETSRDTHYLSHIPFICILLKVASLWRKKNPGKFLGPDHRNELKQMIVRYATPDPENFDESVKNVWRLWKRTEVPSSVSKLMNDSRVQNLTKNSSDFWFMVAALKSFVHSYGQGMLPLSGKIPDMKSDTEQYINLQNIYQEKATKDLEFFSGILSELLSKFGKPPIKHETTELFCKNCASIKVFDYSPIYQELTHPELSDQIRLELESSTITHYSWYLGLLCSDKFYEKYQRYPGTNQEWESDISLLKKVAADIVQNSSLKLSASAINDEVFHEICRCGASELHVIASFMGGLAAQECLKILTRQYEPVSNTLILDGFNSTTRVYQL